MPELMRPRRERLGSGPGGLDDIFSTEPQAGLVTISHGLHIEQLPVANMTVREIRQRFADRFDIETRSRAQIDGRNAADDEIVRPGQQLMFMHHAGEKGRE